MNYNLVILISFFTFFIHGMETNSLNIKSRRTAIHIIKGSVVGEDGKVDVIVVGKNQQRKVKLFESSGTIRSGKVILPQIVYEKNKDNESSSGDETYKPYTHFNSGNNKLWQAIRKPVTNSLLLTVVEPCIGHYSKPQKKVEDVTDHFLQLSFIARENELCPLDANKAHKEVKKESALCLTAIECSRIHDQLVQPPVEFAYTVQRFLPDQLVWLQQMFFGEEALHEAVKDLTFCYKNVLTEGIRLLEGKEEKSIAIPTISTQVGFPRKEAAIVAVSTIIQFVRENPNAYCCIKLLIKKTSDFNDYISLFYAQPNEGYYIVS